MAWIAEEYVGAAAGVGASFGWLLTSVFFTAAGRRIGPTAVNGLRLVFAVVLLAVTHRFAVGVWVPEGTAAQFAFLAASGLVGLAIGDQLLYTAFVDLGPRLTLLIMTTAPIFAAVFGLAALGETIGGVDLLAMLIAIGGVAWVVAERPHTRADDRPHPHRRRGVLLAVGATACQAGGALLSKQGMGHGVVDAESRMDPLSATLVRMVFALVFVGPMVWAAWSRRRRSVSVSKRVGTVRAGVWFTAMGAVCGPFLGVWASLIAYDREALGVAQTLCSLSPVLILPVSVMLYKERLSVRAVLGAVIALAGTAALVIDWGGGSGGSGAGEGAVHVGVDGEPLIEP